MIKRYECWIVEFKLTADVWTPSEASNIAHSTKRDAERAAKQARIDYLPNEYRVRKYVEAA